MENGSDVSPGQLQGGGEVEKLSKENFNLKLRIFYLEERVAKLRKGGETDESLQQEILEQKVLLEEKQQELDSRNLLLVKARNAIEGLHTDLALCKAELEDCRAQKVSVEELQAKDEEIDALKHKLRQVEEREHKHGENVLVLNNQLRDATEQRQLSEQKLESIRAQCKELERQLQQTRSDKTVLEVEMKDQSSKLARALRDYQDSQAELENLRGRLVESANSLGDQRRREAELLTQLQEKAKRDDAEISRLKREVKHAEQERSQSERASELSARQAEELQEQVDQARALVAEWQDKCSEARREMAHIKELHSTKEESLRTQGEMVRDQMERDLSHREAKLKSDLAELKGRYAALEFSRDEAYERSRASQDRIRELEAELRSQQQASKRVAAGLEEKLAASAAQLEQSRAKMDEKEKDYLDALRKTAKREQQLRKQMQAWDRQISGRLDDFQIAALNQSFHSQRSRQRHEIDDDDDDDDVGGNISDAVALQSRGVFDDGDDDDEEEQEVDSLFGDAREDNGGGIVGARDRPPAPWVGDDNVNRPQPRTWSDHRAGSPGTRSRASSRSSDRKRGSQPQGSARRRVGRGSSAEAAGRKHSREDVLERLDQLRDLRNMFSEGRHELERKWQSRFEQLLYQIERSEDQLKHAESKLAIFMQSMQTLASRTNVQLKDHHHALQHRNEELKAELHKERLHAETRLDAMETRIERFNEEKERLHEQLAVSRERAAQLEGEVRQVRLELDAARKDRSETQQALEQLHGSRAVLKENNRVLSLEVEDRGKRIKELLSAESDLHDRLEAAQLAAKEHESAVVSLERRLEHTQRQIRARDRQLRETKDKLDRSILASSASGPRSVGSRTQHLGNDDFERNMWQQVEETERAIRSSSSAQEQHHTGLDRSIERFSEVFVAVVELVERTSQMASSFSFSMRSSPQLVELLQANHALAQELHELGIEIKRVQRQLSGGGHPAAPTTVIPSRAVGNTSPTGRRQRFEANVGSMSSSHKNALEKLQSIHHDLKATAADLQRR
ncbi:CDK5 regulatory subunit-associated protein 2 (CDK5 activator-binding protein C48) [Durusdinium trenchii]|uniref:CDK5 regulatory subunit-associated protein 2 (CDK5 activator-binding protein C48) n=1 Tax=Durusdinium trenchii TaxID=1381693 RepID=A0ABP0JXN6_9DINO